MQGTKVRKKPVKRVIRDRFKTTAVYWVAEKFNCTTAFVYATIRGDYDTGISGEVKNAFNKKYSQLQKALEA